jgi:hypothetical protein
MNEIQKTENKTFSLVPQNMSEAVALADRFSKSGMVPKHYLNSPNSILVAWEYGGSLGLGLMQSLQAIAVINGMPCIWGDNLLALVYASGQLEEIDESVEGQCTVKRKGKKPATATFTMDDAKKAGLVGKAGPWSQYPKRMLQMRVRAFALRDNFPDILKGMQVAEEVQDYVNPYPNAVDVENNKSSAPIKGVLTQPTKPTETVTDQETGEITTPEASLTLEEMNESLDLFTEIADLRQQKDSILREITKDNPQKLDSMDEVIKGRFKGLSLSKIKEQRDFLLNLA